MFWKKIMKKQTTLNNQKSQSYGSNVDLESTMSEERKERRKRLDVSVFYSDKRWKEYEKLTYNEKIIY